MGRRGEKGERNKIDCNVDGDFWENSQRKRGSYDYPQFHPEFQGGGCWMRRMHSVGPSPR